MEPTPAPDPTQVVPDPTGGMLPAGIFDGPYGYLVAIAFFAFLAARELRRYRELDVAAYRGEIEGLKADVAQLRAEVDESRQAGIDHARDSATEKEQVIREAALERERLIRENAGLRALCAENRIDTTGVPQ